MGTFMILLPFLAASGAAFPLSDTQDVSGLVKAINKLGIDIHRKIGAADDGNFMLSPLGISTALGMLYYGSRGKTAEELKRGLGYQDAGISDSEVHASFKRINEAITKQSEAKEYRLYIANTVLTQKDYPILAEYKDGLLKNYKATAKDVDFKNEGDKVVKEINDWVKLKTNNQIEKLLDSLDPSTVMALLNALYFKGTWKTEFDPEDNTEMIFYNKGLQSGKTTVQMMNLVEELPYVRYAGGRVVELPYKGEKTAMLISLPDSLDGAYKTEQQLSPAEAIEMLKDTEKTKVRLAMPKFKMEYEKNLNTALQELGIKNVFENSADLSGISKAGPIAVSQVIHKTAIEVNEEGSEASGVTGVVIENRMGDDDIEFVIDHPFLFAIYDKVTGGVYFQGRISNL